MLDINSWELSSFTGAFHNRDEIDEGGKIILPNSVMVRLSAAPTLRSPMLFRIENLPASDGNADPAVSTDACATHCGVLEFTAEEGTCTIPLWVYTQLGLGVGENVRVTLVELQHGNFVRLRPQESEFLRLSNPRIVLERFLSRFSALTVGDVLQLKYNKKLYLLHVDGLTAKYKGRNVAQNAVCIVETDVEVEFLPALFDSEGTASSEKMVSTSSTQESRDADVNPAGPSFSHINFLAPSENARAAAFYKSQTIPNKTDSSPATEEPKFPGQGRKLSD